MTHPMTSLERNWCLLLEVETAEEGQNFYDLGGDSLIALELFTRVAEESGWELPIDVLFAYGTYGDLVERVPA